MPYSPFGSAISLNAPKRKSRRQTKQISNPCSSAPPLASTPSPAQSGPSYQLVPAVKRRCVAGTPKVHHILREHGIASLPFGKTYTQASNLPVPPDRVALDLTLAQSDIDRHERYAPQELPHFTDTVQPEEFYTGIDESAVEAAREEVRNRGQHQRRRISQWNRWSNEVIPSLILPFLDHQRVSQCGHFPTPPQPRKACSCKTVRSLKLTLAWWNGMPQIVCLLLGVDLF